MSWPDAVPLDAGLEAADWHLVTMRPVPAGDLERCLRGLEGRSPSRMNFAGSAAGTDVRIRSICHRDLPIPERIGAAGSAWLAIDSEVGRVWTVNGEPKTLWHPFMVQRRALLERLAPQARLQWLAMVLQRSEPLFAAAADAPSANQDWSASTDPKVIVGRWAELSEIVRSSGAPTGLRTATGPLGLDDLASLFVQAYRSIAEGRVDDLAAAAEKIFEARWVLDTTYQTHGSDSLAMMEDVEWFDDALRLAADSEAARDLFAKNLRRAGQAHAFAVEHRVRADVKAVSSYSGDQDHAQ